MAKLTDQEAQEMLTRLARHFGEPVMPVSRYCAALRAWETALTERVLRIQRELFPDLDLDYRDVANEARLEAARKAFREAMNDPLEHIFAREKERAYRIRDLRSASSLSESVRHVFLQISKSNLLARTLYNGEKVRTRMCPEHKGKWSGIEWTESRCPHGCQLTGWLPEPEDGGKPLPGVQAVRLVPISDEEATMVRDVDGTSLGTVRMTKPEEP